MANPQHAPPFLRTKLYRPPVTEDFVQRPIPEALLDDGYQRPLTVVTAPAGYGKTTLVSHWVASRGYRSAWVSLDESDNDVRVFLTYVLEAIRTIEPAFGPDLNAIAEAEALPPTATLATYVANALESLDRRLVLVLDDFHRIRDSSIYDLIDSLLAHPSRNLHLLLATRRDPLLSLSTMRARNLLAEVRMRELMFSVEETRDLMTQSGLDGIDQSTVGRLQERTEGWPAGIRLALLASQHTEDAEDYLREFGSQSSPVQQYVFDDVISGLPETFKSSLVYTSILDRFCSSLCDACLADEGADKSTGASFMESLRSSGLPWLSLDSGNNWVRYHHLFGKLLRQKLEETADRALIANLHKRASSWFAANGYIEEAIHHSIAAGDAAFAIDLVGRARHALMVNDEWPRLERWVAQFDTRQRREHLPLTLLEAWLDLSHRYRLEDLGEQVRHAEALLEKFEGNEDDRRKLEIEIGVLQSPFAYVGVDARQTSRLAGPGVTELKQDCEYIKSIAGMYRLAAHQLDGEIEQTEALYQRLTSHGQLPNVNSAARLMQAMCFIYWADADALKLETFARRLLETSVEHDLPWSVSFAHYFLGTCYYEQNELDDAIMHLRAVVDYPHHYPIQNLANCAHVLAFAQDARGDKDEARSLTDQAHRLCAERRNAGFAERAEALKAELAMRHGNLAETRHWVDSHEPAVGMLLHRFFNPELAWVKAVVTHDLGEHRHSMLRVASEIDELMNRSHHRRLRIDLNGIRAIDAARTGKTAEALELLREAVDIGQPGRLIRPLADLGPPIARLLGQLDLDEEGLQYVGQILAAIPGGNGQSRHQADLPETLSDREIEILALLAQDLSNKEIAERLFISTGTVKRHAHNIYGKLAVGSRREAVSKAAGLGIFQVQ